MYYRNQAKLNEIFAFIKKVAERSTVAAAAKACCPGVIIKDNGFLSCPTHSHREDASNTDHCSIKGGVEDGKAWHCFRCGCGGDTVAYVAEWHEIKQLHAAQLININLGLGLVDPIGGIRDDETHTVPRQPAPAIMTLPTLPKVDRQPPYIIDNVYQTIADICRPSPELVAKLKAERGMTQAEIERDIIGPIPHDIARNLIDKGIAPKDMIGVPGFFLSAPDGRYDIITADRVNFQRQGIEYGILVRDFQGKIIGITTRYPITKTNKCKYGWISSSKKPMGCSAGSRPGWISYWSQEEREQVGCGDPFFAMPPDPAWRPIVICEGYHKAVTARRYLGYRALYVPGIQSTKAVEDEIKGWAEEYGYYLRAIIVPDADCWTDPAVMRGTLQLIKRVADNKEDIDWIKIAIWDPAIGKGIDDVLLAGRRKNIKYVTLRQYIRAVIRKAARNPVSDWDTVSCLAIDMADDYGISLEGLAP